MRRIPALACSTLILLGAASPAIAANPEPAPPAVDNSSDRSAHNRTEHPGNGTPGTPPEHANGNPPVSSTPPVGSAPQGEPSPVGGEPAVHSNGNPTPTQRYPLCHATGSESNPYVHIEVALPAIRAGHGGHDDIIPPVEGYTTGTNWDAEGQAIFANGCEPVADAVGTAGAFGFRAFSMGAVAPEPTAAELPTASLPEPAQPEAHEAEAALPTLAFTGASVPWLIGALALGLAAAGAVGVLGARRRAAAGTILPGDDAQPAARA